MKAIQDTFYMCCCKKRIAATYENRFQICFVV